MNYDSGIRYRDGLNWAATQKARGRQREKRAVGNIGAGGQPLRPSRVIVYKDADLALVERYRTGDKAAFTELMVRYQRPIYNAAFWVLRRADDASDITQEVFLKVAERRNEYDPKFKFFSWIYRIAINESLNLLRQNRRETLDDDIDLPAPDSAGPEQQLGDAQLSERIRSAMMSMTVNDRVVLSLRHFSECSYEAIAQILDLEEKTVKSRLFESRQRLRSLLGGFGVGLMEHLELTRLMHEVLDGAASADEARELDRLLADDPEARAQFDELERLFAGLNTMPKALPPEGLVAAVLAKLPRPHERRDRLRQLSSRWRVLSVDSNKTSRTQRNSQYKSIRRNRDMSGPNIISRTTQALDRGWYRGGCDRAGSAILRLSSPDGHSRNDCAGEAIRG